MTDPAREEHPVEASYHQVFLAPFDTSPVYDGQDAGPLVSLVRVTDEDSALIVTTGCANGPVLVTIDLGTAPLPVDDTWEAQEEVSLVLRRPLHIWSPTWTGDPVTRTPVLTPTTPGPHRVRVSARGRRSHYDAVAFTVSEHYLVQAWPEPWLRPRETTRDDHPGARD